MSTEGSPWKRRYRASPWWAIAFVPTVALLSLGTIAAAERALRVKPVLARLSARERADADSPLRGPLVLRGGLTGPANRVTPRGEPSAAWVAWVTLTTGSGKSAHTRTVCTASELTDLALESGSESVPVNLFVHNTLPRVVGRDYLLNRSPRPMVDLGDRARFAGENVGQSSWCNIVDRGTFNSYVVSIPNGTPAAVSGCRESLGVQPCGDGLDFITRGSAATIARALSDEAVTPLRVLVGVVGALAAVLGLLALRVHVRIDRTLAAARKAARS